MTDEEWARLVAECRRAATTGLRGTWLRGARFARDEAPARIEATRDEGRFNRAGEPALYLAKTLEAVRAECPPQRGRPVLVVQRFDLDLPEARVLARPKAPHADAPTLARVWAHADERAAASEEYSLTHALADAFRDAGVVAVLYPSDESVGDGLQNLALLGEIVERAEKMRVGGPEPASGGAR